MHKRRLILRLSSLGDVILATSALESIPESVDWVVSKEYSELLRGHPKINRVWEFDRSTKLEGWLKLCRELWNSGYDEIIDLHGSLRTKLMKAFFIFWRITQRNSHRRNPLWTSVSKEKFKLSSYFLFKSLWPNILRPRRWTEKFAKGSGGSGNEKPNLSHLLETAKEASDEMLLKEEREGYICVMPGSRWDGKKWPVEKYAKLLKQLPNIPVILGSKTDAESTQLAELLQKEGIRFHSGVGRWNLRQTAQILARSEGYLGGDTGLAHLAEAVGVPATVIFGPTTPEMGFGPWRKESKAIGADLWCRPCGKDGRSCFRMTQRYLCLKSLSPDSVLEQLKETKTC